MTDSKKDTPQGKYAYWAEELNASKKAREKWWKQADKIVNRFIGKTPRKDTTFDLNLFHSNTKTLGDMLYGNTPQIDVSRRYAQPDDDVGRVAAEMMERLLNLDVQENGAEIDAVLRSTLQDRLLAGLGCARVRYDAQIEQVPLPDVYNENGEPVMEDRLVSEDAPIDYYYWGDVLWGWCRNWAELPWLAFRSYLTKEEMAERFGDEAAEGATYKKQTKSTGDEGQEDKDTDSSTQKAEVWEIWCKQTRKVHWITFGYHVQLEEKDDFLQLSGFWPVPPFFIANVTTSLYEPVPDFVLAQDLYNEIDVLQTRIAAITEAVRVVGVYNSSADGIKQMFNAGVDNQLIPVDNWALFGENGGLKGQIDWLPLQDIVAALQQLTTIRDNTIALLQQITGMTDVMRGSLDNQYEGVGQTEIKSKFGSVRIQALQEQFARFAGDLMQIKAEVISRHFSPETIAKRANMAYSKDQDLVPQAVQLIKNPLDARLRVDIRPESVAMVDYQALKNERTEYITSVATYLQSATSLIDADPSAKPFILSLLQWGLAGFKGSSEIEGVIDKAIEASQQEQQQEQKPDPAQMQAQMDMQMEQLKGQNQLATIQAKAEAQRQAREHDMMADIRTAHEQHVRKMAEIEASMQAKLGEIQANLQADLLMEVAQADSNIRQTNASIEGEIQKDIVEHQINMTEERAKTAEEITKIGVNAAAEIKKQQVQQSGDNEQTE